MFVVLYSDQQISPSRMTPKTSPAVLKARTPQKCGSRPVILARDDNRTAGPKSKCGAMVCSYCAVLIGPAKGIPVGHQSHGLCDSCSPKLDECARMGGHQVKKCPTCPRNIGAWLESCVPCAKGKCLVY